MQYAKTGRTLDIGIWSVIHTKPKRAARENIRAQDVHTKIDVLESLICSLDDRCTFTRPVMIISTSLRDTITSFYELFLWPVLSDLEYECVSRTTYRCSMCTLDSTPKMDPGHGIVVCETSHFVRNTKFQGLNINKVELFVYFCLHLFRFAYPITVKQRNGGRGTGPMRSFMLTG